MEDNLELVIDGSAGGATDDTDDKSISVYEVSLDTTSNQTINHGGSASSPASVDLPRMTIVDVSGSGVDDDNTTGDIRVRIPSALGFAWDTSVTAPVFSGSAAGKVGAAVSYPTSTTLRIDVTDAAGFAAGESLSVDGLRFLPPFNGGSVPSDFLELLLDGGTNVATVDRRLVAVTSGLTVTALSQTVAGSADNAVLNLVTVTAGATIGTDTWTGEIRLTIPQENNLSFDDANETSGVVTVTTTSGAVTATPVIEDDDDGQRTLRFDVTGAVAAGGVVAIGGIVVDNASASAETPELYLSVSGPGQVDAVLTAASTAAASGGGGGGGGDFVVAVPGGASPVVALLAASAAAILLGRLLRR